MRHKYRGFSLMEIIIAVLVLAILVFMLIFFYQHYSNKSQIIELKSYTMNYNQNQQSFAETNSQETLYFTKLISTRQSS